MPHVMIRSTPSFLRRVIAHFESIRHDVAGHVGLENGVVLLGAHHALKLLLDRGLANAWGRLTQAHPVDDGVIGVHGERPSYITAIDGVRLALPQCRWIDLREHSSRSDKRQGRREHGDEEERLLHSISPFAKPKQSLCVFTDVSRCWMALCTCLQWVSRKILVVWRVVAKKSEALWHSTCSTRRLMRLLPAAS